MPGQSRSVHHDASDVRTTQPRAEAGQIGVGGGFTSRRDGMPTSAGRVSFTEMSDRWIFAGDVGIDAGTCAVWDRAVLPVEYRLSVGDAVPGLPTALVSNVGDDIDAGVQTREDANGEIIALRLVFVDDVDELSDWRAAGELELPSGSAVLADPYCEPRVPYRQRLDVRPGRWLAEELYWEGDLEAIRLTWLGPMARPEITSG